MQSEILAGLKKQLEEERAVRIILPKRFSFKEHDLYDFNRLLSFFNWDIYDTPVHIDLTACHTANYQALSYWLSMHGGLKHRSAELHS